MNKSKITCSGHHRLVNAPISPKEENQIIFSTVTSCLMCNNNACLSVKVNYKEVSVKILKFIIKLPFDVLSSSPRDQLHVSRRLTAGTSQHQRIPLESHRHKVCLTTDQPDSHSQRRPLL